MKKEKVINKLKLYGLSGLILCSMNICDTAYGIDSAGWIINNEGKWSYIDSNHSKVSGCWRQIDNYWYAFDACGNMITGWYKEGRSWYYLDSSGAMKTGWINDGKKPYYLYPNGTMASGWFEDGTGKYFADKDGNIQYGKVQVGGRNYEFAPREVEGKIISNAEVTKAFTNDGIEVSINYSYQENKVYNGLNSNLYCGNYYIGTNITSGNYKILCKSSRGRIKVYDKYRGVTLDNSMNYGEEKDNVLLSEQGSVEVVEGEFELIYKG